MIFSNNSTRRPRRLWAALAAPVLIVAGLGAPGLAAADTAPPSGTPATVSADVLPTWQINGVVWSQVLVGNIVYVTGSFTKARPPGVAAGGAGEVDAANIFAYDITTGNRVHDVQPLAERSGPVDHRLAGRHRASTSVATSPPSTASPAATSPPSYRHRRPGRDLPPDVSGAVKGLAATNSTPLLRRLLPA